MEEIISLAIRALSRIDERMGQYWSRVGKSGGSISNDWSSAYQKAKRELNEILARPRDFVSVHSAATSYLSFALEILRENHAEENSDDAWFRKSTVEMVRDYIERFNEFNELEAAKNSLRKEFQVLSQSVESQRNAGATLDSKLAEITNTLNTVYGPLQRQYDMLGERLDSDLAHIQRKREEIDALTGLVTGNAVTSSYQQNAVSEKKIADVLRLSSLFFMISAISFAAASMYFSAENFDLSTSIFRAVLAILISIPAAYLARESAKHRKQQYVYLQTALDVQAITPYIASLPVETQNKLKEEMASKVFVAKNFDHVLAESYPISLQEIIIAAFNAAKRDKEKSKSKKKE